MDTWVIVLISVLAFIVFVFGVLYGRMKINNALNFAADQERQREIAPGIHRQAVADYLAGRDQ